MRYVLGLDTSCYTTSVAAVSLDDYAYYSERRLLLVKEGARGLRQSEALFQHITALPDVVAALMDKLGSEGEICAVCASSRPRDVEGSYMPVFLAGAGQARQLASVMRMPYFETSHQQGHVSAAMVGNGEIKAPYLAVHLSGGTTEVLWCEGEALNLTLLGGSSDIHAGQLVDRVGVALKLPFPCGPHLEKLCEGVAAQQLLPASLNGLSCSFSGAEAACMRLIAQGMPAWQIAAEVYGLLERTVYRLISTAVKQTGVKDVLLGGGIASSARFKNEIVLRAQKVGEGMQLHFSRAELAGDNAVGVALIGARRYLKERT